MVQQVLIDTVQAFFFLQEEKIKRFIKSEDNAVVDCAAHENSIHDVHSVTYKYIYICVCMYVRIEEDWKRSKLLLYI